MLDLSPLNLSKEQEEQVMGLIEGKINPEFYSDVQSWIRQCYHRPKDNELIHCALNEVIEGYGVEVLFDPEVIGELVADYVNMGDTYIPTIINHCEDGWLVMSWGDMVEKNELNKE